jgi:hypothetical protein
VFDLQYDILVTVTGACLMDETGPGGTENMWVRSVKISVEHSTAQNISDFLGPYFFVQEYVIRSSVHLMSMPRL